MKELLDWAFISINFPLTLLLLVILLYWLTVIVGLIDFSFLHFDIDADIHIDGHAHVHLEKNIHVDVKAKQSLFTSLLNFFNLGKVPFMIFLSFMVLFMWSGSILGNYYLHNQSVGFALLLLIPNFISSLFLTKFLTFPLIHVFSDGKNEFEANSDLIGKPCTLLLSATEQKVGQAEVLSATGAPLLLTVKTTTGHQLKRGERGLVIDYDPVTHTYLIEPFDQ
ncbi:MAG: hypothetical protein V4714_11800 [Bacteroidota bacterium]